MSFVHLHTHSHYSIGRAVPRVRDLVKRAKEYEMPALALTDNNSVAGLGDLADAAKEFGIQPIIGAEIDILPSAHGFYQGRTHRLTALVETEQGYRNLVTLISIILNRPSNVPPHATFLDLLRHSKGLIFLTGSPRSELYYWLREGNAGETKNYLNRLAAGVGAANIFFEVMEYPHPRTRNVMDYVQELSKFLHVPAVVTQNVHYLDPEDVLAYCALVQHPRLVGPQWPLPEEETPTRHFTSTTEMQRRFAYTPHLLEATLHIAERCAFQFPRRRSLLPVPDFERGQDAPVVLWDKAVRGAAGRYGALTEAIKERLNLEYSDICSSASDHINLAEYLLFLQDIMSFARESEICRGSGRGSLITSVIAYALGIVEVDPLAYDLPYRSLRKDAIHFPVFQMEASTAGMEQTLEFLRARYGDGYVAAVGKRVDWVRQRLFQHLSRWAGLSSVSLRKYPPEKKHAAMADPETEEETAAPSSEFEGFKVDWDEEVETSSERGNSAAQLLAEDRIPRKESLRRHQTLARVVYTLHPCPRGFEPERAQYVLSKEPINSTIPVFEAPDEPKVSLAEADLLDRLLMPRILFTSQTMLNILEAAQNWVRQESNPNFSLSEVPLDDEGTFKLLGLGVTNGIAPLHGITAKSLLRTQRPKSIAQLLAIHAGSGKRMAGDHWPEPMDSLPDCILSYKAAYLKVHHPVSFMAAMLTHSISTSSATNAHRPSFQILLREARQMGIEVLGPNINFSSYEFSEESNKIRTGLMVVQGLGRGKFQEIKDVRYGLPFSSLADFCQRTDPRRVTHPLIANLIKAGAFDTFCADRTALMMEFERALKNARRRETSNQGADSQMQIFDPSFFEEENSPALQSSQSNLPASPARDIMRLEQEAIGYSISIDLLDHYDDLIRIMRAISPFEISPKMIDKAIYIAGYVDHIEREGMLIEGETEMVLDLEGYVVKIPHAIAGHIAKVQNTRGPILVEGTVKSAQGEETHLLAHEVFLLEEVARRADEVQILRLDLAEENSQTVRLLRALLKSYKGNTKVEIENYRSLSWWNMHGVDKARVFFCPPLYRGLLKILPEERVALINANGRRIRMSEL